MMVTADTIAAWLSDHPEVAGLSEVEYSEFHPDEPGAVVIVGWRLSVEGYRLARFKVYAFEASDENQAWEMLEHAFAVRGDDEGEDGE